MSSNRKRVDAVVVGSGPNGLAAAITLAQAGLEVVLYEAAGVVGGGLSTQELTLPGFHHDLCSAVHPMAAASPFIGALPLEQFGLEWVTPPVALAHPMEDDAVFLHRDLEETLHGLGGGAAGYASLMTDLVRDFPVVKHDLMGPVLHVPNAPVEMARFGLRGLPSAHRLARQLGDRRAQALFAGLAGHSGVAFNELGSGAIALMLAAAAHHHSWPFPRGGAVQLAHAMARYFEFLGGRIVLNHRVRTMRDLPLASALIFDLGPHQIQSIFQAPSIHPVPLRRRRHVYGPGVFKVDYALSEPVPWRTPGVGQAGTVHLGGDYEAISRAEKMVAEGRHPDSPFVLVAQPSLFDATRAPQGRHTLWAYCHVPSGSVQDMSDHLDRQIEHYAPGFRDVILQRHTQTSSDFEAFNPNFVGGDVNGGRNSLDRIVWRSGTPLKPYNLSLSGHYQCSAATPPGGGVHGMGGFNAARTALREVFAVRPTALNGVVPASAS